MLRSIACVVAMVLSVSLLAPSSGCAALISRAGIALYRIVLALGAWAVVTAPCMAELIYDNGSPNQVNGREITSGIVAEDFQLGVPSTLTDVRFWSLERSPGV